MATGTGVAPLYSLARHLLDLGYTQPIALWWGLRLANDICLVDDLEALTAAHPYSPYANRRGTAFDIDRDLEAARSGRSGNGDPLAVSDLFDLLPAFLSHHPDQQNPAPTHVKNPWNRPD